MYKYVYIYNYNVQKTLNGKYCIYGVMTKKFSPIKFIW